MAVSKRDLDGSFNRIRSANPGPLPSNRLKIVLRLFPCLFDDKVDKSLHSTTGVAERPDALLTELAARLLEIDMGERLAVIVPDDVKQASVSSSVQGGDKRGQAEVAAETHKPPRLRPATNACTSGPELGHVFRHRLAGSRSIAASMAACGNVGLVARVGVFQTNTGASSRP